MAEINENFEFDSVGEFDEEKQFCPYTYIEKKFNIPRKNVTSINSSHTYKYFFIYSFEYIDILGRKKRNSFKIVDKYRAEQEKEEKTKGVF
jgi:hypothetical protein